MTENLRIALIQQRAAGRSCGTFWENRQENLHRAVTAIHQAAQNGADLVLFPELWSHSYEGPFPGVFDHPHDPRFEKERREFAASAVERDGDYLRTLQQAARESHIGAVVTALTQGEKKPRNTAFFLGKDGEILLTYDKVHTCDFSMEALMENGEQFFTCDFEGVRVGVMICFDREFPESARELMLQGSEVILVPNACGFDPARLNQLSTRAFENMVDIAMANYPDTGWGQSCVFTPFVFGPDGPRENRLFCAGDTQEGIFCVDLDMQALRTWRQENVWGEKYRRPQAYRRLSGASSLR